MVGLLTRWMPEMGGPDRIALARIADGCPGRALLLATGSKPAMLTLQPWYTGPRAAEITAAETAAMASITARATAIPGADQRPIPSQPVGSETEARA